MDLSSGPGLPATFPSINFASKVTLAPLVFYGPIKRKQQCGSKMTIKSLTLTKIWLDLNKLNSNCIPSIVLLMFLAIFVHILYKYHTTIVQMSTLSWHLRMDLGDQVPAGTFFHYDFGSLSAGTFFFTNDGSQDQVRIHTLEIKCGSQNKNLNFWA